MIRWGKQAAQRQLIKTVVCTTTCYGRTYQRGRLAAPATVVIGGSILCSGAARLSPHTPVPPTITKTLPNFRPILRLRIKPRLITQLLVARYSALYGVGPTVERGRERQHTLYYVFVHYSLVCLPRASWKTRIARQIGRNSEGLVRGMPQPPCLRHIITVIGECA